MATEYRSRRFRDGDAPAINALFEQVTGRRRSVEEFEWQWLSAPGGPGEIWLIEAVADNGDATLIGHHGIMPIRFSRGSDDFLFGKTENTMVLPEYRSRILYPRFEKRFAAEYESRFSALFSTTGPPEALRQRRALGYRFSSTWVRARFATGVGATARLLSGILLRRIFARRPGSPQAGEARYEPIKVSRAGAPLVLRALTDGQASRDDFFSGFWPGCRSRFGLTPRRDREDLDWRFWSNPYAQHINLVSDACSDETGYVILKTNGARRRSVLIEDIVPSNPGIEGFRRLLVSALAWMRANGIDSADFATTRDQGTANDLIDAMSGRNLYNRRLLSRFHRQPSAQMPRKITASGLAAGLDTAGWFVTPMLSEGRND